MSGSVHLQMVNNVYLNIFLEKIILKNPSLLIGLIPFLLSFDQVLISLLLSS